MLPCANYRKRVVVLASSPGKSRVLVIKDSLGKWNIPDTHKHWKVGKILPIPLHAASVLLKESTLGIACDVHLTKHFSENGMRKKLPSGGYIYEWTDCPDLNIEKSVASASAVAKFLNINYKAEMKAVEEIKLKDSFAKYGAETIEAVRFLDDATKFLSQ